MTFDNVPEDHINYFSTFQAQNPGRFLSCLRKEMALLMFSLPAGIIVRGYENRVVSFFLSRSLTLVRIADILKVQVWMPLVVEIIALTGITD